MKLFLITLLLSTVMYSASAQVSDNFNDGDFTTNPTWMGDDSLFRVVSGELKLNGTIASDAHLSTDHNLLDSVTWTFYCRFDLSPSTQNFARFYLVSDKENLEGDLNGYYVQLGGVTGNSDSITLYRQNGSRRTRIIGGRPATVSKSTNKVRIKVFRDDLGNWSLYSDTTGRTNYIYEGSGFDNSITFSNYLGLYVKYTAGNNQRYYLDDVKANKPVADVTAPLIDSIKVNPAQSISVYFDEELDQASAQNILNYYVSPETGNPLTATLTSGNIVKLDFENAFISQKNYVLSVQGVKDVSGNEMLKHQLNFRHYTPAAFDLLISEFMADPSPVVGLPEQEFVELYNNTTSTINLHGFTISDGGTPAILPDVDLDAGSFIIVCSSTASSHFAPYGKLAIVTGMPSLNNSGDNIILKDKDGNVIHQIAYDLSWYQDLSKKDGGYTIELNYPNQLCKGKAVYSASSDVSGGTPGKTNSLWSMVTDSVDPGIASATVINSQNLLVVFDEIIDVTSFNIANIYVEPSIPVLSVQPISADSLQISLSGNLSINTSYTIHLNNIKDCSGNAANMLATINHYVPQQAQNYDVLISEIMADPDPPQKLPNAEFIELYNRSDKIISLKNWSIGDDGSSGKLPDYILLPDSFITITNTRTSALFNGKAIGITGFPSLGNDGDNLVLKNEAGQVIHAVSYTSAWYTDGFKKQGGFSLEMIDAQNPCGLNNWKATNNKNGGTPGKVNSVKGSNKDKTTPRLSRAYLSDGSTLQLFFTESLDSTSFQNERFMLNGSVNPINIHGSANHYQVTNLKFNDTFAYEKVYSILVDSIYDCAQNMIENYKSVSFRRAFPADSGSLVINEVLFNSRRNAYDFVELYNKSSKPADLKNMIIARRDAAHTISDMKYIAPEGFVVGAGEYAVITENPANLQQHYYCKNPSMIIPVSLPPYNDDKGFVILMNNAGVIYDELAYNEKMHFSLLDDKDGVSLERIDFNRATDQRSNWTSAAASVGYATPTYKNSQYLQAEKSKGVLKLQPSRISPDGDGFEDVMNINYTFSENGYTGNLWIYDASGRMIKQLFKNEVLGTSGTYTWDGITDNGTKAPVGIYIFRFEAFNLNGNVKEYSAVGVVAGKL